MPGSPGRFRVPADTVLPFVWAAIPDLSDTMPSGKPWPTQTLEWWETWRLSEQAATFTATDVQVLLATALLHGSMWYGETRLAGEIRLREASLGATATDRARMRIVFAQADGDTPKIAISGRSRHKSLSAAPGV